MKNKIIRKIIIILIVTFILEITVFNMNFYRVFTSKNKQIFKDDSIEYIETEDNKTMAKISNVNTEIKTVHIQMKDVENIEYRVFYTDETSSNFLDLPLKTYIESFENSKYIPTYLSGKTNDFEILLNGENARLEFVEINTRIPMNFSIVRILILSSVIIFIVCFRNLEIFKNPFSCKNMKQEFILLGILGVFLVFICFINYYSKPDIDDFYNNDFIKALSKGSVSLEISPSEKLMKLDNPYDTYERVSKGLVMGQDYIWDIAYYNGKYYVYFGILPALVLYLPYYLITGELLKSSVGVLIFSILSAISIKALIEFVFRKYFKNVSFGYVVLSLMMLLFGSQILVLNGIPRFYELAIASGLFFAITGFNIILMLDEGRKKYLMIFLGALFLALSVACRPTFLFVSLAIIPILFKLVVENIKDKKELFKIIFLVAIPYVIVGILLMIYNYIRFDSIFEFGSSYQLTIMDMKHLSNRVRTAFMGMICNLFGIPIITPNFPFILNQNNLMTFYGYYYIENMLGGLFIMVPICFAIFKIPNVFKKSKNREIVHFICSLSIVGILICFISTIMAGSVPRYIVDYGWMLVLAGICTFIEFQNILESKESKHILKKIFAYITIYVVIMNICGGIVSEKSFMREKSPEKFFRIKYTIDFWE